MGVGDRLGAEQPIGALDGQQRALGVLGDAGQHPLALGPLAPAAVGLLGRLAVVELEPVVEPLAGLLIERRHAVEQLAHAVANQPHGVLGGGRAEHR
nr:hypothetical protein [Solirubrobacterales bacterium]